MLILIAHNGKSLEVNVQPDTRSVQPVSLRAVLDSVSTIQETLVAVTSIQIQEQILMCNGVPLDPSKPLSTYLLPGDGRGSHGEKDVFLYNKTHLRQGAAPPPPEPMKPLSFQEPIAEQVQQQPHLLDNAGSPLVRALPEYDRQFRWHLQVGRAGLQAVQQRQQECSDLVSEMQVQSRAIDSARANVEHHYTYIYSQFHAFSQQYAVQKKAHKEILDGFERELEALAAVDLHPAACTPQHRRLVDLVNAPKLREWARECASSHRNLADKVVALEELYTTLKADVEALFMQAPTVHLETLATKLHAMHPHLEEQASIVQVLQSDFGQIQRLVAAAMVEVSSASSSGGVTPLDKCQLMETMHDNHAKQLLPQIEHYRAIFEHFCQKCVEDKNQMTRDVMAQLQKISAQQSKILAMRNKLAIFREAAVKEDDMFAQLLVVRRIPAAYRQCLAECMRRQAFAELYAGQAHEMAERMGRLRQKECDKRDAFKKHIQGYIPVPVLAGLGLTQQPAHCQISLPPQTPGTPTVTLADLRRAPMSVDPAASASTLLPFGGLPQAPTPPSEGAEPQDAEDVAEMAGAQSLEMENARLRAELAMHHAEACLRALKLPGSAAGSGLPVRAHLESGSASAGVSGTEGSVMQPGAGSAMGDNLPADVEKFQTAIKAKQELLQRLERHLAHSRQQNAAYETRIFHLESRMAKMSARSGEVSSSMHASGASVSSSGGSLPTVTEGSEGPAPLALTPVANSPTRSVSPATAHIAAAAASMATLSGVLASREIQSIAGRQAGAAKQASESAPLTVEPAPHSRAQPEPSAARVADLAAAETKEVGAEETTVRGEGISSLRQEAQGSLESGHGANTLRGSEAELGADDLVRVVLSQREGGAGEVDLLLQPGRTS